MFITQSATAVQSAHAHIAFTWETRRYGGVLWNEKNPGAFRTAHGLYVSQLSI